MAGKKATANREAMTTIWIEKDLVDQLKERGHMGDTYSTVIRRLLTGNGKKPDERGITGRDE